MAEGNDSLNKLRGSASRTVDFDDSLDHHVDDSISNVNANLHPENNRFNCDNSATHVLPRVTLQGNGLISPAYDLTQQTQLNDTEINESLEIIDPAELLHHFSYVDINEERADSWGPDSLHPTREYRSSESRSSEDLSYVRVPFTSTAVTDTTTLLPRNMHCQDEIDSRILPQQGSQTVTPDQRASFPGFYVQNHWADPSQINDPTSEPTLSLSHSDYIPPRLIQKTPAKVQTPPQQKEKPPDDNLKNKLISAWNNMRHGFTVKSKTSFKYASPIWLLGKRYAASEHELAALKRSPTKVMISSMNHFRNDFASRLWFTYRKDFTAIDGTHLTSDMGWGCMLRSSQMMMGHAFICHFMGRDWRWYRTQKKHEMSFHHQIIRFLGDFNSSQCPLSIHRLVSTGKRLGKKPGDWYGPSSVVHVIRQIMECAAECNPILGQLCVYVAQDCTIYKSDLFHTCRQGFVSSCRDTTSVSWRPVVIMIPVRLGGEHFNPVYTSCIKELLQYDQCIGIIGGKPKHSVYFIGWQDDYLIYMDPHFCQDTVNVLKRDFSLESYHCLSPRKMHIDKIDPSCTIGFYCKSQKDFERLEEDCAIMAMPQNNASSCYPMFVFSEGSGSDIGYSVQPPSSNFTELDSLGILSLSSIETPELLEPDPDNDTDDFVIL